MTAYASNQAGNWTTTTVWTPNGTPGTGDTVSIGHNVYVDSDITIGTGAGDAVTIGSGGILRFESPAGAALVFTVRGDIEVASGGEFRIGTSTSRFVSDKTCDIVFNVANTRLAITNSGTINIWGAENYHCAASIGQRTTLVSAISSGAGVAFEASEAVDWSVGDYVAIGTGGDKTTTPTTGEKVQITAKTDSTHYQATFANNHHAGDFIVLMTRNVTVRNSAGYSAIYSYESSAGALGNASLKLDWCALQNMGYGSGSGQAGVNIVVANAGSVNNVPTGKHHVKNCTFDTHNSNANMFYVNLNCAILDSESIFDYLHFYNCSNVCIYFTGYEQGRWRFDHMSVIHSAYGFYLPASTNTIPILSDGYWYSGIAKTTSSCIPFYGPCPSDIENFKFVNCYFVAYTNIGGSMNNYRTNEQQFWKNGYVYWASYSSNYSAFYYRVDFALQLYVKFENVAFYAIQYGCVNFYSFCGEVYFIDCSFDKCNVAASTDAKNAPISIWNQNTFMGKIKFQGCTFGTSYVNERFSAISAESAYGIKAFTSADQVRIIFENCIIKRPNNWAWADANGLYWEDILSYALQDSARSFNLWKNRVQWGYRHSLEFVDCQILNAAGVDQWPSTFSGVTRLGIVAGGAELRNEGTTVIDSSLALAILPLNCIQRCHVTKLVPIRIPVEDGDDIEVRVSLRKTQSQADGRRPTVHMFGCGIDEESEMSNVNNSWEEQVLSGTADCTGVVEVWFSVFNEADTTVYQPDSWNSPKALGWLTVYVDGISAVLS